MYSYFYNIFLFLSLIILFPVLFVKVIISPKYKGRILRRLGKGLRGRLSGLSHGRPRIWIHALSVGEAASARSLLGEIRCVYPQAIIIFSATTRSGEKYSKNSLEKWVDLFIPFPLDLACIVRKFITLVEPDLFILIETDFWPNFLHELAEQKIPAILVNGRVSANSYRNYKRFRFLFKPMFASFRFLAMQTSGDVAKFISLGLEAEKVRALGNLKYDSLVPDIPGQGRGTVRNTGIAADKLVFIAGSIHKGEEEIIFRVFGRLLKKYVNLFMVIAPRELMICNDLLKAARLKGFNACFRTAGSVPEDCRVMILDTMGELAGCYGLADLAFVGGSMVAEGGHNPLEPAALARPVIFGPHMEDFAEISRDLLAARACMQVADEEELFMVMEQMLADKLLREEIGQRGADFVSEQQGVTRKHVELISNVLADSGL